MGVSLGPGKHKNVNVCRPVVAEPFYPCPGETTFGEVPRNSETHVRSQIKNLQIKLSLYSFCEILKPQ